MTSTPPGILCDLYLRLSDARNENGSFEQREATLRTRATQLGWTVRKVVTENDVLGKATASAFKRRKVGVDENGYPIMRVNRPGFRQILDDLRAGRVHALLTEDLDRSCRDPKDLEDLIDVVRATGAWADSLSGSLKFTAGGTDGEITMARLMVTIAHKSSADNARRQVASRQRRAEAGRFGGGRRPYGFEADGITVHPEEAAVLRRVAEQVLSPAFGQADGISMRGIVRGLTEKGIVTADGRPWHTSTLRDSLIKPSNAGIIVYKGEEVSRMEGEPILPREVWEAVCARLKDPTRFSVGRAPRWLGTNLYRCLCDGPMEIHTGAKRVPAYRCGTRVEGVHVRRNAAFVDDLIARAVVRRMSQADAADLVAPARQDVDVPALRVRLAALREMLDEFARDRADGVITRDQMIAGTKRVNKQMEDVQRDIDEATDDSPLRPLIGAGDVKAAWENLTLGHQRAVVNTLMRVQIMPAPRGRGTDPNAIKITWNC